MEIKTIKINKPDDLNIIIGQAHFIKTIEDIYEALISSVSEIKFGIGFCESSGPCLVRFEGNDEELKNLAAENALNVGAGHSFIILMKNAFPINVLNAIKNICEVCSIYCASANPIEIIIAETTQGRGILGVIDGKKSCGIEQENDIKQRKEFLRKIGYKK
ncbi:MAG: adenosine-specific kinase [bacterium]